MNENLEDSPRNFMELFHHGFACIEDGDHDQARENFTKALKLSPLLGGDQLTGLTYWGRGFACFKKGNFIYAFREFVKANDKNQVLKTRMPEIYVADKIANIYKVSDEEDGGKAFGLYCRLLEAVSNIQQKQFYAPQENAEVAHYTSLHTLKSLTDKGRFRLYNAAYMNDPEEGREFFKIMQNSGIDVKNVFYRDEDQPYPSPAYIGSFVKVDERDEEKDKLFLWRTYGKHDGQEAAGTCLIFKHEGTVFAERCGAQIGAMQQLQSKPLLAEGDRQIPDERQPRKPDLYKIVYSDEEIPQEFPLTPAMQLAGIPSSAKWNKQEPSEKLAESLKQIKEHIENEKNNKNKKELRKLACDLLDTIRFLFKSRHYREEKEVRVVQIRYYDQENTTQESTDIQVDTEQNPPRFYLETHENFRFGEVMLGPQTLDVPELIPWLKERGIKAKRSDIPYGKPYS